MSIKMTPGSFGKDVRMRAEFLQKEFDKAITRSLHRGRAHMTKRTPVDTGQMKNSWRALKEILINDAPHAGVIEKGARPHKVSMAGIESLSRWAQRQLGANPEEAKGIAWGIAKKIEKFGQKGLYITRDSLPALQRFVVLEITKVLKAQANRTFA